MDEQIIIAGFGGQGVQLIGQLLTYAGMNEDKYVSFLPSYGPEMRGGTTNCNVIISTEPVGSPIVGEATAALVLNRPSMDKFEGAVAKGGALIVNSSLIEQKCQREDIKAYYIPANDIAKELGNDRVANMVMLGAYIQHSGAVQPASVMAQLTKSFGERRAHLLPVNEKAIAAGMQCVKDQA
jgi:2-oxoglutarate ferredoxin oxidoreductase subunit gamma